MHMSNCIAHGLCLKIPGKFGWVSDIHLRKVAELKAKWWKEVFGVSVHCTEKSGQTIVS